MSPAVLLLLASSVMIVVAAASAGGRPAADAGDAWLMMVATRCNDARREAEFNAWYDDIDIPDVLEVPGYLRARRGSRSWMSSADTLPATVRERPGEGESYVALYDIASADIDKTIIDMLMATRKMEQRGRSTDLLTVTERVYYRRHAPPVEAPARAGNAGNQSADAKEFIYMERMDCCGDAAAERRFNLWYDEQYLPQALQVPGMLRATRYALYRVLMVEPKQASRYLTVYELLASNAEEGASKVNELRRRLRAQAADTGSFSEGESALYLEIKDVKRSEKAVKRQ